MHRSIKVEFSNFNKIDNQGHVRAKVNIAYSGNNRNYSKIPKESFEKAIDTLKNIPVVGNWLGDNFGGHDVIFEEKGNEIVIKDATVPLGVVPENCNPRWETITDEHGDEVEYFTCDVILWHERYPEQIDFIINNGANQSMEIMVTEGDFDESDYFIIDDFYYSALCVLGTSDKESDNVEPAFEDSKITVFKLDKKFESKFNKAIQEESKEDDEDMEFKEKYEELQVKYQNLQTEYEEQEDETALKIEELEAENEQLTQRVEELEMRVEELEAELEVVETEKLEASKQEIVSEYDELLAEEVIEEITKEIKDMSLEDLEFKLAKAVAESVKEKMATKDDDLEVKANKSSDFSFTNKYNM